MMLRKYEPGDAEKMAALFYDTVHSVNIRDYTKDQVDAWAAGNVDLEAWNKSFLEHNTLVAVEDGRIIGFGDMDLSGYFDRLYIHKDYQGRGIATAICDALDEKVCPKTITVAASITARPFFENRGYHVVRKQQVERRGVLLTNFVMEKHFS